MNESIGKIPAIAVLGPTASGKSDLAVDIALKHNGEIISADSRQVYTGLDIGSGKITQDEMRGIPHHLLDIIDVSKTYTAFNFQKDASIALTEISKKGALPILCGGTNFYAQTILENLELSSVPENPELRTELGVLSPSDLFSRLQSIDQNRAETIDPSNTRRLVRAIEIATTLGHVPPITNNPNPYTWLKLGIKTDPDTLRGRIKNRIHNRMNNGMREEVEELHKNGVSWERLESLGLEYRYLSYLIKGEITRDEFDEQLLNKSWQFSKRQMTWLKRDEKIIWITLDTPEHTFTTIETFLKGQ